MLTLTKALSEKITEELDRLGREEVDPVQVAAWLYCWHGTLDALGTEAFRIEVEEAVACIDVDPAVSKRLPETF